MNMTTQEADMRAVMVVIGLFNESIDMNTAVIALTTCERLAANGVGWLEKLVIARSEMKQNNMFPNLEGFMSYISDMTSDRTQAALSLAKTKGFLEGGPKSS